MWKELSTVWRTHRSVGTNICARIYTKANDMDRLINELTYYSSIDNNRIPYNFHRINVAEFRRLRRGLGLDLESKNIQLNYSNLVEPDTRIIADPEQLKKVINNIIGNSIKYMDKEKGVNRYSPAG